MNVESAPWNTYINAHVCSVVDSLYSFKISTSSSLHQRGISIARQEQNIPPLKQNTTKDEGIESELVVLSL